MSAESSFQVGLVRVQPLDRGRFSRMVSCQPTALAYRSTVLRPQHRCRAIARREWPWASNSWTRACAAFLRSAPGPRGSEPSCARPDSGRVVAGSVPLGDGLRRQSFGRNGG